MSMFLNLNNLYIICKKLVIGHSTGRAVKVHLSVCISHVNGRPGEMFALLKFVLSYIWR